VFYILLYLSQLTVATRSLSLSAFLILYFGKTKQQVASDTETAQMKKVSLVSSDVLHSYNKAKTDALSAQPVTASSSFSSATAAAAASNPAKNVRHFDMVLMLINSTTLRTKVTKLDYIR
jgi:hypothetical protein